ncbi:MAG: elongation factor Ts [Gammaproteobacteria bacterium]|nr:elongation factor Ts [Gammaproteobacteria bacterium]MYB38953.1 elongation factor Ts [Gammaproteobacteria bacterium]
MQLIKELRERTGVGFGDCKKALAEAGWEMEEAIAIVRRESGAKAAKKADRTAAEGLLGVVASGDGERAAIVEINIETDFAAKNEKFVAFVAEAAERTLAEGAAGLAEALEDRRAELVAEIGENISVRRAARVEAPGGTVGVYLHQDSRQGALVGLTVDDQDLARDLAMHVTAMRPLVVAPADVPEATVARERAIFEAQAAESGKPANIVEKMVEGRVRKFLSESSLTEQPFVKDAQVRISKLLKQAGATCTGFERFQVGEGVEKATEDFAAEVAAQVEKSA